MPCFPSTLPRDLSFWVRYKTYLNCMTKTEFDSYKLCGILELTKEGDVISKVYYKIRSLLGDATLRLGKVPEHGW